MPDSLIVLVLMYIIIPYDQLSGSGHPRVNTNTTMDGPAGSGMCENNVFSAFCDGDLRRQELVRAWLSHLRKQHAHNYIIWMSDSLTV